MAVFGEDFIPLEPRNFFGIEVEIPEVTWDAPKGKRHPLDAKRYLLPDMTGMGDDAEIGQVSMGWSPEGLIVLVKFDEAFDSSVYPDISRGDAVELFIDTRDVKTSGFNTRFCHHFFFLPNAVDGVDRGELTHFRTEDRHELCEATELGLKQLSKKSLEIRIPTDCMTGYDPVDFGRIGLSYRLWQHGEAQHFSVSTNEYAVEQQPSLWSTARFVK